MKSNEIRPLSTYMGKDGVIKKITEIRMDVGGDLYVSWKVIEKITKGNSVHCGATLLDEFAKWAKNIKEANTLDLSRPVK